MKGPLFILVLFISCFISFFSTSKLYTLRQTGSTQIISPLIFLPEAFIKTSVLEFSGIVADYLMLKTMVFHGERLSKKQALSPDEWQTTYIAINQVTNLDPKFLDPYVFAATSFPWDAGMISETNELLLKAAQHRQEDYRPYFFVWFNYFYFLNDIGNAAKYLEMASLKPNAPPYLTTLAARNNMEAGKIEQGILFLSQVLKETSDPARQYSIKTRLKALMTIQFLEKTLHEYVSTYGQSPNHLNDLISQGFLKSIPPDPYGGVFYITPQGTIYTTSKLVPIASNNN
ncbi:hypothetical protein [Desulfosediminicola ganghwensis]|uniref:hypothetical protein n=1 Tax=Desulfosediminicola ganghwensis TaxID=2569540 RepID=UPI0010ABF76F|nr:hypothetical protein [Desulfosediminicola ganghwensis]